MLHDGSSHAMTTAVSEEKNEEEEQSFLHSNDPDIPFNWPFRTKWTVTLVACYVTFIVGFNATSITSAAIQINETFHVTDQNFPNSFWPVTTWTFGAAVAPMIVLPILEDFGMRLGYLISYIIFTIFVIPQAVAKTYTTFTVCRFFAGCAGGVLQDGMDGIIADIWPDAVTRSLPVTCYVFFLLAGVTMGSVIGGGISKSLDWHWIIYSQLIIYCVSFFPVLILFKETRGPVIMARKLKRTTLSASNLQNSGQAKDWSSRLKSLVLFTKTNVIRPAFFLTTEPVVFFATLLTALSYGIVFISTQSVAQVYTSLYSWKEYQSGLVQSSIFIGECLGFLVCLYQNQIFRQAFEKNKQTLNEQLPEVRLYLCIPGSFLGLAGGLVWYGWTSYQHLHWILPTIGLCLVGFGSMVVMAAIMMYLTDSYAKYAASASAAACFGEEIFAAFLPLATQSMYRDLGFHWASTLLGFIAFLLSFAPILLVWKGREIRRRSPFMKMAAYQ